MSVDTQLLSVVPAAVLPAGAMLLLRIPYPSDPTKVTFGGLQPGLFALSADVTAEASARAADVTALNGLIAGNTINIAMNSAAIAANENAITAAIAQFEAGNASRLLASDSDVTITNPQDGNVLIYSAVTGKWINGPAAAAPAAKTELTPTQLNFAAPATAPYFDPQPTGLFDFSDSFAASNTLTQIAATGTTGTASLAVSANAATVTTNGTGTWLFAEAAAVLLAPQFFISATASANPVQGQNYNTLAAGICKNASNFVIALHDTIGTGFWVQGMINGQMFNTPVTNRAFTAPCQIGLSLVGNSASVWLKVNGIWQVMATANIKQYYDFEAAGALLGWMPCFEVSAGGGSSTWTFSSLTAGRFGGVGMRDMVVVQNPDGTPFIQNGNVLFTASAADPNGWNPAAPEFGGTYCGVFTLHVDTRQIVQTGVIMVSRNGLVTNDHAAAIVAYPNGDRRVLICTWGTDHGQTVRILHTLIAAGTQPDILTTNVTVLSNPTVLSVPTGAAGVGFYDPSLVWDAANARYLLAYTIHNSADNSFHAALASSPDMGAWTLLGEDSALGWEGTRVLHVAGRYWAAAGGPSTAGNATRIYDLTMTYLGSLSGFAVTGGGSANNGTNPHPMVFPHPDGLRMVMFSFDGTRFAGTNALYTWGQPYVQTAPRYG